MSSTRRFGAVGRPPSAEISFRVSCRMDRRSFVPGQASRDSSAAGTVVQHGGTTGGGTFVQHGDTVAGGTFVQHSGDGGSAYGGTVVQHSEAPAARRRPAPLDTVQHRRGFIFA